MGYQKRRDEREEERGTGKMGHTHTTATTRLEGNKDKRSDKTAQPQLQHQQRSSMGTSNRDTLQGRKPTISQI